MDLYQEVTNRIMEQLENGIIPWEKPWISAGNAVSHATGKPYSLLNQMLLGRPGEYVTFKQCQAEGGKIRKGEKAQMVVFFGNGSKRRTPIPKRSSRFLSSVTSTSSTSTNVKA